MINGHKKEYFLTFPLYNPSLVLYQNKIFIDSNKRPLFGGAFIRGGERKCTGNEADFFKRNDQRRYASCYGDYHQRCEHPIKKFL